LSMIFYTEVGSEPAKFPIENLCVSLTKSSSY
jgi:hypothetical protein